MAVALISATTELVGVSMHVYNLARLLHRRGLLDVVICPSDGWLATALQESSVPFVILNLSFRPALFLSSSRTLKRFLIGRPPGTLLHLHGRFPLLISAWSLATAPGLIAVATVHQFQLPQDKGSFAWKYHLESRLLRRMRKICCVSTDLRNEVISRTGKSKDDVQVIPNWIEPIWHGRKAANGPQMPPPLPEFTVCAVGRFAAEKGFDVLIRGIAALKAENIEASCHIFGEGPEKENLSELATQLGVSDRVLLKRPTPELRKILPSYAALIIPSRSESFGIVALEAYDAGIPVIASKVEGLRETVLDRQTGLLFEPDDALSLSQRLKELIASEALKQELVANGSEHLERFLPGQLLIDAYDHFYESAIKNWR